MNKAYLTIPVLISMVLYVGWRYPEEYITFMYGVGFGVCLIMSGIKLDKGSFFTSNTEDHKW